MICPQCGEELKENARFCSSCGLSFSSYNTPSAQTDAQARAQADTLIEQTLDGKYFLMERLGVGGMGVVYRARRVHIGDEVAVKVLHKQLVADASMIERFRREARAAAQLRHPNIVSIIDLSEARGLDAPAYIVMELIEGESLRELLLREKRLEPERAVSLMRDICAGVGAAHRKGIFHRDLKPDNVIVLAADDDRERETVKVVDFGIAKLNEAAGATVLTQTGVVMGTPYYMSPEQCRGEALDARADVYSLGAILYELLVGIPPFMAETPTGLIARHLFDPVPPLPQSAGASPSLEAVIMRSLAKDRETRQRDAGELAREVREALQAPPAVTLPAQTIAAQTVAASEAQSRVEPTDLAPTEGLGAESSGQTAGHETPVQAAPASTIPAQAQTPPAAVSFVGKVAPTASKSRRGPLVTSALLVLLLIGGAIVWLPMVNRNEKQPAANQEGGKPTGMPTTANPPRTMKNPIGMEFGLVPAGTFMMGSSDADVQRVFEQSKRVYTDGELSFASEKPQHQVTIREGFYMGRYEVTQAEWQQVMGRNPSDFKNCDQCPVENVSWKEAQEFIRKLSAQNDGYTYRLPTESEWEYACRAGTTGDYAGSLDAMAWYYDNAGDAPLSGVWDFEKAKANNNRTHPVGQKQPNGWGLYDMYGNVAEWCEDIWHDSYSGAPIDGSAWLSGEDSFRMIRGGSWANHAVLLRSANRGITPPGYRHNGNGFRLVAVARQ
jgi:eukaryotic-like serine/threonine-protein kinase